MNIRLKAVLLSLEGTKNDKEICSYYEISTRTLRRWRKLYVREGIEGLRPKPTVPSHPNRISRDIEQRIIRLKREYPHWGARRIKYQFNLPVHWNTVHNVFKRHGLLIRVKAKPQPSRRFQRKHVDSLWQGDTFEFRIRGVSKVYITGFTDDCSRYRVRSRAYLRKRKEETIDALRWALRKGRIPKQIYLDNGKQFIAKDFKKEAKKYGIRLIFGRPYNAKGRGKIEAHHRALYRELIYLKEFTPLSHFRRELWNFDQKYNTWRKQEIHGWKTPSQIYYDRKYFNEEDKIKLRGGHMFLQQNRT